MGAPKSIADFKPHTSNPRAISSTQLSQLGASITQYGDLSGIVVNVATGNTLISGHQRTKTLKGKKTRIVKTACKKDAVGTVATGWVEVLEEGHVTRIPYREVHWPDKMHELIPLINANSAGGEFDRTKLGVVLAKLEKGKFAIESIAMDKFDIQKAFVEFERTRSAKSVKETQSTSGGSKRGMSQPEEFESVDPRADTPTHVCPRCKYKFY